MLSLESHASPLGMSCWVPILRAAGLWVLRTMEGGGEMEMEGEREEVGECMPSWEEAEEDWRSRGAPPRSAGEGVRGVGESEVVLGVEVREQREGMLEVELRDGVGVRRLGGEGLGLDGEVRGEG